MSKIFHAGNLIIAGFVIAALSMLALVYKTSKVDFDLSTQEDPYSKEIEFNQQLIAQKNSVSLGENFKIEADSDKITVILPQNVSQQIKKGRIEFYCYSNSQMDTTVQLVSNTTGIYNFNRDLYMKGKNYKVKVWVETPDDEFYKELIVSN